MILSFLRKFYFRALRAFGPRCTLWGGLPGRAVLLTREQETALFLPHLQCGVCNAPAEAALCETIPGTLTRRFTVVCRHNGVAESKQWKSTIQCEMIGGLQSRICFGADDGAARLPSSSQYVQVVE